MQRCLVLFNESIKSPYTRQNYIQHIKKFQKYANITSLDDLAIISSTNLQTLLEDYLVHLKNTSNANSIPTMFLGLRHFFVMNRIKLDWEIIRKMYPLKTRTVTLQAWQKHDIQQLIDTARNKRDKALFYFLISTGARIGVFDNTLSIKHVKKMPEKCLAVKLYAETLEEYWSFLTPQASAVLINYLNERIIDGEVMTRETPLFRNTYRNSTICNVKKLNWSGVRSIIYRMITKSKVNRTKCGFRYNIQAAHGFRKFFNTTLKINMNVNYNIAEKLMGHRNGLDGVYLTPTIEQCFAEFKKAIHDLTI